MDEWYKKCKSKKDKEVEMKKVEKYIREIIKANGELSTTYKHSKDSNNYGRLFAYPSIQSLSCNIRGFLFCGHTDFDFIARVKFLFFDSFLEKILQLATLNHSSSKVAT